MTVEDGPYPGTYLLLAGAAATVDSPDAGPAFLSGGDASIFEEVVIAFSLLRGLHRRLWWRGRGMVAVWHGWQRYAWTDRRARDAVALAGRVEAAIRGGTWVPGANPPPSLPGAEPYYG